MVDDHFSVATEAQEQKAFIGWLRNNGYLFVHPATEGRRSFRAAQHAKAMGALETGVPDILILGKGITRITIAIEMKRSDKSMSRVSPAQVTYLKRLTECGWDCHVAYGAVDAIGFVRSRT